jgi:ABC-type uncharacterized transport system permease subunit
VRVSTRTSIDRRLARPAGMVAGLAAGWLALALIVWAYGDSPRAIAGQVFAGTWGMPYGIGQVLYKATTLLLTGVAVDVALRAGLFNVGVEGQLAVAGLAVATVGARSSVSDRQFWISFMPPETSGCTGEMSVTPESAM